MSVCIAAQQVPGAYKRATSIIINRLQCHRCHHPYFSLYSVTGSVALLVPSYILFSYIRCNKQLYSTDGVRSFPFACEYICCSCRLTRGRERGGTANCYHLASQPFLVYDDRVPLSLSLLFLTCVPLSRTVEYSLDNIVHTRQRRLKRAISISIYIYTHTLSVIYAFCHRRWKYRRYAGSMLVYSGTFASAYIYIRGEGKGRCWARAPP